MLDTTTKKRIDDCRDILVGKLPDPKAQIEQITIGLIYKFMDDMDKEAIELGGKAKYFSDYKVPDPQFPKDRSKDIIVEFSKYSWDNLMNPKVTAAEMLRLYSDAIESMEKNPNIPQLFRDIFNNAYLPYRDPETLKLFLKTIGEFEYTHSEKLGDAFEYLLSVMGSQGDAGQFRTPRHVIDFLVSIIDPDKGDTILDPACGTAGFLISAYKHILLKYTKANKEGLNIYEYNKLDKKPFSDLGDKLTPDERKKLIQNFAGYDISPDMVRLSLVNLYLHGFSDPHINEYDTLSSEERWNENFDVVLANPPFMSPKGGIRPHKKFTISSNRSEVLFVDYIAEHLNPKGKAGIIVPEGVIFQSGKAYKDLRKMLVENYLYAVVSLPAGVFNPYSGVKTSILLMDKAIAKKRKEILFVKIDNDGYNLGSQRTAVKGSQLEEAVSLTHEFVASGVISDSLIAHAVLRTEIAANGDFNLSGERYRTNSYAESQFPLHNLSEIVDLVRGITFGKKDQLLEPTSNTIKVVTTKAAQETGIVNDAMYNVPKSFLTSSEKLLIDGDLLMSTANSLNLLGRVTYVENLKEEVTFGAFMTLIRPKRKIIIPKLLYHLLKSENAKCFYFANANTTTNISNLRFEDLNNLQIPLPPLSVQEEIVAEIEGYQKIIDGAKAVVANYKPKINIDPDWEMVELENVLADSKYSMKAGPFGSSLKKEFYVNSGYKIYGQEQVIADDLSVGDYYIDEKKFKELKSCEIKKDDILISLVGTIGKVTIVPSDFEKGIINPRLIKISLNPSKMIPKYFKFYFQSETIIQQVKQNAGGGTMPVLNGRIIKKLIFALPPLEKQHQIVVQFEKEQDLVNANMQLIEIFEQKIKDRIAKVWGTTTPAGEDSTITLKTSPGVSSIQGEEKSDIAAEVVEGYE